MQTANDNSATQARIVERLQSVAVMAVEAQKHVGNLENLGEHLDDIEADLKAAIDLANTLEAR